jgi:hypothetical protein
VRERLIVDLLVLILAKSSIRYSSDRTSRSSVRGALERYSVVTEAIVISGRIVVVFVTNVNVPEIGQY